MSLSKQTLWLLCGLLICLAMPRQSFAQGSQDEVLRSLGTRVEEFLRDVEGDNMRTSVETLLTGSPLLNNDMRRVRQLQETIHRELPKYGPFVKVEMLKIERVGLSIVRCVYLYHCKNYPVAWSFTFYKSPTPGKSEWVVVALKFDVDYDKLPATAPKSE